MEYSFSLDMITVMYVVHVFSMNESVNLNQNVFAKQNVQQVYLVNC